VPKRKFKFTGTGEVPGEKKIKFHGKNQRQVFRKDKEKRKKDERKGQEKRERLRKCRNEGKTDQQKEEVGNEQ